MQFRPLQLACSLIKIIIFHTREDCWANTSTWNNAVQFSLFCLQLQRWDPHSQSVVGEHANRTSKQTLALEHACEQTKLTGLACILRHRTPCDIARSVVIHTCTPPPPTPLSFASVSCWDFSKMSNQHKHCTYIYAHYTALFIIRLL
jgi:hypothetical protein